MVTVIPDDTDYSGYVDKEIGETITEFIDWLGTKVDYPKLDDRSVFLALRLYGPWQRSESHQDALARKARGDSSPPRPSPARGRGAKPKTTPGSKAPGAAKAAPAKSAAKAAPAKAAPAKPARGKPATASPARGGKRGAVAPY